MQLLQLLLAAALLCAPVVSFGPNETYHYRLVSPSGHLNVESCRDIIESMCVGMWLACGGISIAAGVRPWPWQGPVCCMSHTLLARVATAPRPRRCLQRCSVQHPVPTQRRADGCMLACCRHGGPCRNPQVG